MSTLKGINPYRKYLLVRSVHDILKENNNIMERNKLIELDKIGEKYDELYLDEKSADVHFLCGPDLKRIPAHKNVLCEASDVFRTMFYGSMAREGDIKLPETSYEAFKNFLKFCYFKLQAHLSKLHLDINLEVMTEVMFLGEMYLMPLCVIICFDSWLKRSNHKRSVTEVDQIFTLYHFILLLEADYMMFQWQIEFILSTQTRTVLKASSFINCSHYVLDKFLELETLSEYESKIFKVCLQWARQACKINGTDPNDLTNVRQQLKSSVYKIRYGAMTMAQFECHIPKSQMNIFFPDPADCDDVTQLLLGSKVSKTGHFIVKPRVHYLESFQINRAYFGDLLEDD